MEELGELGERDGAAAEDGAAIAGAAWMAYDRYRGGSTRARAAAAEPTSPPRVAFDWPDDVAGLAADQGGHALMIRTIRLRDHSDPGRSPEPGRLSHDEGPPGRI